MTYEYRAWWRNGSQARVNYGPARTEHWACAEDVPEDAPIAGIEVRATLPWEESTLLRTQGKHGGWS